VPSSRCRIKASGLGASLNVPLPRFEIESSLARAPAACTCRRPRPHPPSPTGFAGLWREMIVKRCCRFVNVPLPSEALLICPHEHCSPKLEAQVAKLRRPPQRWLSTPGLRQGLPLILAPANERQSGSLERCNFRITGGIGVPVTSGLVWSGPCPRACARGFALSPPRGWSQCSNAGLIL
jgi:hypothetical protein